MTDGVYNLHLTSAVGLNRIREIFRVQQPLDGLLEMDTTLRGKQGTFALRGGWLSKRWIQRRLWPARNHLRSGESALL